MAGYIYILTDGANTKIGKTTSLDKRLSAYKTHNPNFYVYKVYECSIEDANKIEAAIKGYFKENIAGAGKEWFSVQPEKVNRIVSFLLEPATEEVITPAMHGIKLPKELYEIRNNILVALAKQEGMNTDESYELKDQVAELFAGSFKLGLPQHKLPSDLVIIDDFGLDLYHCEKDSGVVDEAIKNNRVQLPYDDHTFNFYHLVKLASGYYVAICTCRVSMPYLKAVEGRNAEISEVASKLGLYAFNYDDWSWHFPDETGLILFMHKTPVQERLRR